MPSGINNKPSQGKQDWTVAIVGAVQRLRAIADSVGAVDVAGVITELQTLGSTASDMQTEVAGAAASLDAIDTTLQSIDGSLASIDTNVAALIDSIQLLTAGVANWAVSFVADSMTVTYGTLDAGTVATLEDKDGSNVAISEAAAANALEVSFGFTGVTEFTRINFFGRYTGAGAHTLVAEAYNYATSAWDIVGAFTVPSTATWHIFLVPAPNNYVDGGDVTLRLRHLETGNTSHDLYLDYLSIQ